MEGCKQTGPENSTQRPPATTKCHTGRWGRSDQHLRKYRDLEPGEAGEPAGGYPRGR
jgi:hypothetical protein